MRAWRRVRLGYCGEQLACSFLRRQGYFIWKRNWRCRAGELDIITYNSTVLRFIEVKTRRLGSLGNFRVTDALHRDKCERLGRLARAFMQRNRKQMRIRRLRSFSIDAITVLIPDRLFSRPEILHIVDIIGVQPEWEVSPRISQI